MAGPVLKNPFHHNSVRQEIISEEPFEVAGFEALTANE